jgi:hypothetical protein
MIDPFRATQNDQHTPFPTQVCPLCENTLEPSQYPRHRILLEDGTDTDPHQVVENRLCTACWEDLAGDLS